MERKLLSEAEKFFHEKIPLTRTMGVRVTAYDERGLVVEAPVSLNHNHLQTAFGGSVHAVATLAGYGLIWLELHNEGAQVVIAQSNLRFHRAIRETITAICQPPGETALEEFLLAVRSRGKACLRVTVRVEEHGVCAAEFQGVYVARRCVST